MEYGWLCIMARIIALYVFYTFLFLGLIYYLIYRIAIMVTRNIKLSGLIILLFGTILTTLFVVSLRVDYTGGNLMNDYYQYLSLSTVSLIYMLSLSLPFLSRASRTYIRLGISRKLNIKSGDKHSYLYVLYKHERYFYLIKEKESYKGYIGKFKKTSFHDEAIKNQNQELNITGAKIKYCGKVTMEGKKKLKYFCYIVLVKEELMLKNAEKIGDFQLMNYNMTNFDKEVILNMLLKEDFNIKL